MLSNKPTIIMDNTESRVVNISTVELSFLRESVLFFDSSAYAMAKGWAKKNRNAFKTYMVDENGHFPSGIIQRVLDHLAKRSLFAEIVDNRVRPKLGTERFSMRCSEPPAYSDQVDCVKAMLDKEYGIAQVPTGVGKTRIAKDTIQQMQTRTVVITPSTALREQMAQYLEDCFGSENVGVYDKRCDNKPIEVINYQSFGKTDPKEWEDYNLTITDEFHRSGANTIRDFNISHLNNFYHRFGLTATNFASSDDASILLESVLGQTVFAMSIRQAISKGYITPIIPIFYDISNSHIKSKKDYRKDVPIFIDKNEIRNNIGVDIMNTMKKKGLPCLGLVNHLEHGRSIQAMTDSSFINGQEESASYNKMIISSFNNLAIPSLIGTSVLGEGVDTKACQAVINFKGGKSKKELLQNIGRAVRNYPGKKVGYYFDFIDRGQRNLTSHSRQRMKIIEQEFGIAPRILKP